MTVNTQKVENAKAAFKEPKAMIRQYQYIRSNETRAYRWGDTTLAELLFLVVLAVNLAILVNFTVYQVMIKYYYYIIFATSMVLFLSSTRIEMSLGKILGIVAFLAFASGTLLLNHSSFSYICMFVWPLAVVYMFKYTELSPRYINRVGLIFIAAWIGAVISTYRYGAHYYFDFLENPRAEINPNTTALVLCGTCLFFGVYIDRNASKPGLLKAVIYTITFLLLEVTRSRASTIGMVVVVALEVLLRNKIRSSRRLGITILSLALAAGILFPLIYILLLDTGVANYDTIFMGKRIFTGREVIWTNLFDYLSARKIAYIIGVGVNTTIYGLGSFNMHNAYLQLLAQYGLPITLVYLGFIIYMVYDMYGSNGRMTRVQFKCYQVIVFLLLVGIGETILSYLPTMIFFVSALGIGSYEKQKDVVT